MDPNDNDWDRVKLIVETAHKKSPSINILISLGYEPDDLENAAATPAAFADSVRALVHRYDLNGFDIDFESARVGEEDMLTLAREIRRSLNKIPSTRPMIMTIAPDQTGGLNKDVLEQFTYVMAQTYGHACSCFSFDDTDLLAEQLGSYERIVYGVNSEGLRSTIPTKKRGLMTQKNLPTKPKRTTRPESSAGDWTTTRPPSRVIILRSPMLLKCGT